MAIALIALPFFTIQALFRSRPLLSVSPAVLAFAALAVAAQLTAARSGYATRFLVPLAALLGATALARSLHVAGGSRASMAVTLAGAAMNAIPIMVFGAMPVRTSSRAAIVAEPVDEHWLTASKHVEVAFDIHWSDPVTLLGDVIPLFGVAVVSMGDLVLLAGFLLAGLTAKRSEEPDRGIDRPQIELRVRQRACE